MTRQSNHASQYLCHKNRARKNTIDSRDRQMVLLTFIRDVGNAKGFEQEYLGFKYWENFDNNILLPFAYFTNTAIYQFN